MKNRILIILVLVLFASCSKEEIKKPPEEPETLMISIEAVDDNGSSTHSPWVRVAK